MSRYFTGKDEKGVFDALMILLAELEAKEADATKPASTFLPSPLDPSSATWNRTSLPPTNGTPLPLSTNVRTESSASGPSEPAKVDDPASRPPSHSNPSFNPKISRRSESLLPPAMSFKVENWTDMRTGVDVGGEATLVLDIGGRRAAIVTADGEAKVESFGFEEVKSVTVSLLHLLLLCSGSSGTESWRKPR